MKRLLSILLSAALVLSLFPLGVLADGTAIKVTTTASSPSRGDEVTFVASIEGNTGFNSITNMCFEYDPSVLRYIEDTFTVEGGILNAGTVNSKVGLVSFASAEPITATGSLFRATFRILRTATGNSFSVGVTYDKFRVSTSGTEFADVNPTISPCSVTLKASAGGFERISGHSRTETAADISYELFSSAENAILVDGNNFADALAGVSLAYAMDAPILLVRNSKLDEATLDEIDRLGVKTVTILGGTTAISQTVTDTLKNKGYAVNRISGYTRFDTAVQIAYALAKLKGAPSEVFFVVSNNFPDALAVSNVSALKGCPVLYIAKTGILDDATKEFLTSCGATKATIIGGTTAISEAAEANIAEACGFDYDPEDPDAPVTRIFGRSRYDTCLAINEAYAEVLPGDALCVATGTNFPDALAGGVFAASYRAPLLLVGTSLSDAQKTYLSQKKAAVIYVFGGTGAVSDNIAKAVVSASK